MAGYTILASGLVYIYSEILSGSRNTSNTTGDGDSTLVRYRAERVDGGQIDPDAVQLDVIAQLNFLDPHPIFPQYVLQAYNTRVWDDSDTLAVVELPYAPFIPEEGSSGSDSNEEQWEFNFSSQPVNLKIVDASKQRTWERNKVTQTVAVAGSTGVLSTIGSDVKGNNPEGVDVYRPAGSLVVRKFFTFANFTSANRDAIYELQGKLNSAAFSDFGIGEALFLGAPMQYNYNTEIVSVTYTFLVGKRGGPIPIKVWNGKTIAFEEETTINVSKDPGADNFVYPFDYLWTQQQEGDIQNSYDPAQGTFKKSLINSANYVEVYERASFAVLGLGSGPA